MQDSRQVQYGSHAKQLPVTARKHTLAVYGVARVRVTQESECGNRAKELVANGPAERPLAAEEAGAIFVVRGARGWEGDEEGRDGHVGLRYGISWRGVVSTRGLDMGMGQGNLPARMKENVMQVPATLFTMMLSDILGCFELCLAGISKDVYPLVYVCVLSVVQGKRERKAASQNHAEINLLPQPSSRLCCNKNVPVTHRKTIGSRPNPKNTPNPVSRLARDMQRKRWNLA